MKKGHLSDIGTDYIEYILNKFSNEVLSKNKSTCVTGDVQACRLEILIEVYTHFLLLFPICFSTF